MGPQVRCFKHRDVRNVPYGWCAITAMGTFDPKKGGHLVLWEPKLILEFPPGSTLLIPSATITHSNVPISPQETRTSFTQYCSGGLFRWVDNGGRSDGELRVQDPALFDELGRKKGGRWLEGLALLATMEEVAEPFTGKSEVEEQGSGGVDGSSPPLES